MKGVLHLPRKPGHAFRETTGEKDRRHCGNVPLFEGKRGDTQIKIKSYEIG